jgi:predicted dehydrogenase
MEDVSTDVDGVIVVDDITMTHQQRARFFLREGVPTFIDKPLASTYEEAAELVEIAESAGALVMSSSALRYARETREARGQIEAAGRLSLATAICQGQYMGDDAVIHYGIHPLELAYSVLGPGVATVQNVGEDGGHVVKLLYGDGRILLLLVFPEISQAFRLNLYGENGAVSIVVEDWDYFYAGMLEAFVGMIRDRSLPIPLAETLEIIRVLTAAKTSLAQGGATIRLQLRPARRLRPLESCHQTVPDEDRAGAAVLDIGASRGCFVTRWHARRLARPTRPALLLWRSGPRCAKRPARHPYPSRR